MADLSHIDNDELLRMSRDALPTDKGLPDVRAELRRRSYLKEGSQPIGPEARG